MKEFFNNAWKILLAIGAVVGLFLGMKKKQDDDKREEFEAERDRIDTDISEIEGKEEVVIANKEKQKEELKVLKEEAKKINTGAAELDETREDDINYLKDFVEKYKK